MESRLPKKESHEKLRGPVLPCFLGRTGVVFGTAYSVFLKKIIIQVCYQNAFSLERGGLIEQTINFFNGIFAEREVYVLS